MVTVTCQETCNSIDPLIVGGTLQSPPKLQDQPMSCLKYGKLLSYLLPLLNYVRFKIYFYLFFSLTGDNLLTSILDKGQYLTRDIARFSKLRGNEKAKFRYNILNAIF